MLILYDATIDTDKDTREVYEWALGEFETDSKGNRVLDDNKLPIPINPLRFPLQHCTITHAGSATIISIPRNNGTADFRIDRIAKSAQPKRLPKGNKEIYTFGGVSERLLRQNVAIEGAAVNFTVTKWRAEHAPNQRLQVVDE